MLRFPNAILVLLVCLTVASVAMAGPSLLITKPPVTGGVNAGPNPIDPNALQGQWFTDLAGQNPEVRDHEFYDNLTGNGGGAMNYGAINGFVSSITYGGGTGANIMAFTIHATITNDTNAVFGEWASGSNSHGETLTTVEHYTGTLYKTYLTADFASDPVQHPTPYLPPAVQQNPQIFAVNHDHLAWYCYNELEEPGLGGFWVPTWDFADIPLAQSSARDLLFTVGGIGLDPADPRFIALQESINGALDILLNRTTSLKISDWEDTLSLDPGTAYPVPPGTSSDVSVFHDVPEPATMSLLAIGALAMLRRKK